MTYDKTEAQEQETRLLNQIKSDNYKKLKGEPYSVITQSYEPPYVVYTPKELIVSKRGRAPFCQLSSRESIVLNIPQPRDKVCGIYKITNVETNRVYIGQSINIGSRVRNHFCQLKKGSHHNKFFQKEYDLYGREYFEAEVLEVCTEYLLSFKEVEWHQKFIGKPMYSNVYTFRNIPLQILDKVDTLLLEYNDSLI